MRSFRNVVLILTAVGGILTTGPTQASPATKVLGGTVVTLGALGAAGMALSCTANPECKKKLEAKLTGLAQAFAGGTASEMSRSQREKSMQREKRADTFGTPQDPDGDRDFRKRRDGSADGSREQPLQSGGNTVDNATAKALNDNNGMQLEKREWGRALEELKKHNGLSPDHHGRIMPNGSYTDFFGNVIDSILLYVR